MDHPYQPPAAEPLDPQEKLPKKPEAGFNVLLTAGTAWFISMGVMGFLFSHRSFGEAASPGVVAVMALALISILLSFTSLKSAARVLSFASLIFALAMGSIAIYLAAMAAF